MPGSLEITIPVGIFMAACRQLKEKRIQIPAQTKQDGSFVVQNVSLFVQGKNDDVVLTLLASSMGSVFGKKLTNHWKCDIPSSKGLLCKVDSPNTSAASDKIEGWAVKDQNNQTLFITNNRTHVQNGTPKSGSKEANLIKMSVSMVSEEANFIKKSVSKKANKEAKLIKKQSQKTIKTRPQRKSKNQNNDKKVQSDSSDRRDQDEEIIPDKRDDNDTSSDQNNDDSNIPVEDSNQVSGTMGTGDNSNDMEQSGQTACNFCGVSFQYIHAHKRKCQANPNTKPCRFCGKLLHGSTSHEIGTHRCPSNPNKLTKCPYCNKLRTRISFHIKRCKKNPDAQVVTFTKCPHCDKLVRLNELSFHIKKCNKNPDPPVTKTNICQHCGKSFKRIEFHSNVCHSNPDALKTQVTCKHCGVDYDKGRVNYHKNRCRNNCRYCKRYLSFKDVTEVEAHKAVCPWRPNGPKHKCEYCGLTFSDVYSHRKRCVKRPGYVGDTSSGAVRNMKPCEFCHKKYLYLNLHIPTCPSNPNASVDQTTCPFCNKTYRKLADHKLICHANPEKQDLRQPCPFCGNLYRAVDKHVRVCPARSKEDLDDLRMKRSGNMVNECEFCGKNFHRLHVHRKSCKENPEVIVVKKETHCRYCNKLCGKRIKYHEKVCPANDNRMKICQFCGKACMHMQSHIKLCPLNPNFKKITICEFCGKSYSSINGHRKTCAHNPNAVHDKKPCQYCGEFFTALRRHEQRCADIIHPMSQRKPEKGMVCPWEGCEVRCSRQRELDRHYQRHTDTSIKCHLCTRHFTNPKKLEWHVRRHDNQDHVTVTTTPSDVIGGPSDMEETVAVSSITVSYDDNLYIESQSEGTGGQALNAAAIPLPKNRRHQSLTSVSAQAQVTDSQTLYTVQEVLPSVPLDTAMYSCDGQIVMAYLTDDKQ